MAGIIRSVVRRVRPFWLREKIFYHLILPSLPKGAQRSQSASLAFAPRIQMKLLPSDVGHQVILWTGFYELSVSRRFAQIAKRGGLLVDAGANFGYYTAIWAAANPQNKAIAFEPDESNQAALRETVLLNELDSQVEVIGKALGKEIGVSYFRPGPTDQTGQGGLVTTDSDTTKVVDVLTIDSLEVSIPMVDVLKIDVEGADTWVLQGADKMLREKRIRHIFFEHYPARMDELGINHDAARKFLLDRGYDVHAVSPGEYYATPVDGVGSE